MSSETASTLSSLWLTYVLQAAAGYVLLWLLCRLIPDSRFRFRLWGVFLGGLVAAWLGLLLLSRHSASIASGGAPSPGVSDRHLSWTLNFELTHGLSAILSGLCWAYVIVLALFSLSFCIRSWRLRTLVRASQPASDSLSSLFELARAGIQGPPCKLRMVQHLHSPATAGWRHPVILLPDEFLSRLEAPELISILRHELMHVRRRDYLWDRLATLGCYLVFFHPVAWLVRRNMRWDRELVCDAASVDCSDASRLDYAACLTRLAGWWLSREEYAGPIDFLSSPSLLSTRVRAMVLPPKPHYSASQMAAVTCLAAISLIVAIRLVPEATFNPTSTAVAVPSNTADLIQESPYKVQSVSNVEEEPVLRRHKSPVSGLRGHHARYRSSLAPKTRSSIAASSDPPQPQIQPNPERRASPWRLIPKFGGWTIRSVKSVKAGFSRLGSHLVGDRRKGETSTQFSPAPGAADSGQ